VTVPLERALSKLGLASRAEARALIVGGRVRVNGRTICNPRHPCVPERITLAIDGLTVDPPRPVTIALHKPRGVVTTRSDPEGRRTVYDLIAEFPHHVVPVGRLDYATSGLLLMTNDTRLADRLTDPDNAIVRVYLVTVRGRLTEDNTQRLERGLAVDGQFLHANKARIRKASNRETHLVVELVEGKNREIRRLFSAIGHEVTRLRRVQLGGLTLDTLAPGRWRVVTESELKHAFPASQRSQKTLRGRTRHR
jgi:23S rRNA pseudouridine2605 synthase